MSLRRYHESLFFLIILSLFMAGFLGPKFWKISQPLFNFKPIQNNFNNPVVSIIEATVIKRNNLKLSL